MLQAGEGLLPSPEREDLNGYGLDDGTTRHGDLSITVCLAPCRLDGAGWMLSTRGADMEIKASRGQVGGESDKNLDGTWRAWAPPWKEGSVPPGWFRKSL